MQFIFRKDLILLISFYLQPNTHPSPTQKKKKDNPFTKLPQKQ